MKKNKKYINISENYGGKEYATIEDYRELNPSGDFVEKDSGIFEREWTKENDAYELVLVAVQK